MSLLHGKCRVTGPHRVILMGERGAKQGHYSVPLHPVHDAFVAVNKSTSNSLTALVATALQSKPANPVC